MTLSNEAPNQVDQGLSWACPACRETLQTRDLTTKYCRREGSFFHRIGGIWSFLLPERATFFERFIQDYETVRKGEGRGSTEAEYYRTLPYSDTSGIFTDEWYIRAKSFREFVKKILQPLEEDHGSRLRCLDLGAGNCWLSNRVSERGHSVVAVDLLVNSWDGLGAHRHYLTSFTPVQAEFDRLPLAGGQFDLITFSASLHYSVSYEHTLESVVGLLDQRGKIVILDSPIYRNESSGGLMVQEREQLYRERFGTASNSLPSENFLTLSRLETLATNLRMQWRLIKPFYGLTWHLRPLKAHIRRRREPARFYLVELRRERRRE